MPQTTTPGGNAAQEEHQIVIAGAATTIRTPAGFGDLLIAAMTAQYGYTDTVPDPDNPDGPPIPNPVTPLQFTVEQIITYCRLVTAAHNRALARAAADAQVTAANAERAAQIEISQTP